MIRRGGDRILRTDGAASQSQSRCQRCCETNNSHDIFPRVASSSNDSAPEHRGRANCEISSPPETSAVAADRLVSTSFRIHLYLLMGIAEEFPGRVQPRVFGPKGFSKSSPSGGPFHFAPAIGDNRKSLQELTCGAPDQSTRPSPLPLPEHRFHIVKFSFSYPKAWMKNSPATCRQPSFTMVAWTGFPIRAATTSTPAKSAGRGRQGSPAKTSKQPSGASKAVPSRRARRHAMFHR